MRFVLSASDQCAQQPFSKVPVLVSVLSLAAVRHLHETSGIAQRASFS